MNVRDVLDMARRAGDAPPLTVGPGTSALLPDIVPCDVRQVLVVASRATRARVPGVAALLAAGATGYHDVRPNPTVAQALALSSVIERLRPTAVVAVGGGSTIDLAKAARLLRPEPRAGDWRADPPELVAVPTTAGSGSEVTPFATLYRDGRKISLDAPQVRPDHAVLDGVLVASCPHRVAAAVMLDALCHAIESLWSRDATVRSRRYAACAANALVDLLVSPSALATWIPSAKAEDGLLAATVAGLAIACTRTTAAHAFSYWLTAQYGVPHGFACAANLGWLARYNWDGRDAGLASVLDWLGCAEGADQGRPVPMVRAALAAASTAGLVSLPSLTGQQLPGYVARGLAVRGRADRNPVRLDADRVSAYILADRLLVARPRPSALDRLEV